MFTSIQTLKWCAKNTCVWEFAYVSMTCIWCTWQEYFLPSNQNIKIIISFNYTIFKEIIFHTLISIFFKEIKESNIYIYIYIYIIKYV